MTYGAQHSSALATMQRKGAAVTLTVETPGTLNPLTETWSSPTTTEVEGYAIEVPGDPKEYEALGLIQLNPATLFFVPTSYGAAITLGAGLTWAGSARLVKRVKPLQPDGTPIGARVIVA